MAAGTLLVLDFGLPGGLVQGYGDLSYARTMAFTTLVLFQLFNALNARSTSAARFTGCSAIRGYGMRSSCRSGCRYWLSTHRFCSPRSVPWL